MLKINLIEGESTTRDKNGKPLYQIHPRLCVFGGAAHITTPLLKAGEGPYGPIHSWASIVVKRGWGKSSYYVVRKAPFWSDPVPN